MVETTIEQTIVDADGTVSAQPLVPSFREPRCAVDARDTIRGEGNETGQWSHSAADGRDGILYRITQESAFWNIPTQFLQ